MQREDKGQIIVPTGGGKTYIMINDFIAMLQECNEIEASNVTVVVAPRILLAQQLCDDFYHQVPQDLNIFHAHSGRTSFPSSTKSNEIAEFVDNNHQTIIFTTYHSLKKVVESDITIDCIYFDESHNGTAKSFFDSVSAMSKYATRCYYFTATPRISYKHDRGMNNKHIWGNILESVPAPELIDGGSLIPPTIIPFEVDTNYAKHNAHVHHSITIQNIIDSIELEGSKVLISVPSSKVLINMLSRTYLIKELRNKGYDLLHITSKFGAYVNNKKVNRSQFFETLKQWGEEKERKFVIFHYSILSEGINVSGLTHTVFLRNLNIVEMAQSIGRVIRMDKQDTKDIAEGTIDSGDICNYRKSTGYCIIPTHKSYGTKTLKRMQRITDDIFRDGVHTTAYC